MNFTHLYIPKHIKKAIELSIPTDMQLCTRFPPQPSGYLHIGHLFACRLNQSIARVYNGKFLVRFDDTNPEVESTEFVSAIYEDLLSCGFDLTNLSYTSDSFQMLIDRATDLVKSGNAYIDFSSQEQISEQRRTLQPSPYRTTSIEFNIENFNKMIDGNLTGCCLRLLAFYDSKNSALRDPVLYRSLNVVHHRTGNKFKIYPTYDFACPILDSYDNVTHVFRSKEYSERDDQMKLILTLLSMRIPKVISYGRISIENCPISKREIKQGIIDGLYIGWNDKKLFTYRGMINKGFSLKGINNFLDDIGFPEANISVQKQKFLTINKKSIDAETYRLIGIYTTDITEVNTNLNVSKNVQNFIGNSNLGSRIVNFYDRIYVSKNELSEISTCEEFTIIYIGNAFYNENTIQLHLEGDPKKTSKKILWLDPTSCVRVKVEMFDCSVYDILIESHILNLKKGDYVQLNKIGYFYIKETLDIILLSQVET